MRTIVLSAIALLALGAQAEESTCTVKGMSCESCVSKVQEKVCSGDKFATCEVKYDSKTKTGMIHIVTKDMATKVDAKEIGAAIADTSYKVAACAPTAAKEATKNKKG